MASTSSACTPALARFLPVLAALPTCLGCAFNRLVKGFSPAGARAGCRLSPSILGNCLALVGRQHCRCRHLLAHKGPALSTGRPRPFKSPLARAAARLGALPALAELLSRHKARTLSPSPKPAVTTGSVHRFTLLPAGDHHQHRQLGQPVPLGGSRLVQRLPQGGSAPTHRPAPPRYHSAAQPHCAQHPARLPVQHLPGQWDCSAHPAGQRQRRPVLRHHCQVCCLFGHKSVKPQWNLQHIPA